MPARFQISDEVRQVLSAATITSTTVKLEGQLDRPLYVAVNKVLEGAGGKWNRKAGVHVFTKDPRELLGLAVETGTAINEKQLFQNFYTPEGIADLVAKEAKLGPGMTVLEPSCGEGALIRAAFRAEPKAEITAYDIRPEAVEACVLAHFPKVDIHQADFLTVTPSPRFDRVIMNPPFTKGQDMEHVEHAWGFLKPGGRLVAITSVSWQTGTTHLFKAFQKFAGGGVLQSIPRGTFSESGTEVPTVLITMDKPR